VPFVFGRRSRQETEELLRAALKRLDVSAKETAVLVKTITALKATIGVEIERARQLEATADATARTRHEALAAQAVDVSAALEHVASMYARLAERVEADRLERPALAEAIGKLGRQLMAPDPNRPRVVGGTVFATPVEDAPNVALGDESVEVAPAMSFEVGTAVCCRFGDQWIDGVDIAEVLDDSTQPYYRLRRRHDGYLLPPRFCARDLRLAARPSDDIDADEGWVRG
jgi:hypothetical protein